jgi:hypothetical protein
MSTKKKVIQKVADPKAKYRIGTRVFFINYLGNKTEILEGEIEYVESTTYPEKDNLGKTKGYTTLFDYNLRTVRGQIEIGEISLFANFGEAAKAYSQPFLTLLK